MLIFKKIFSILLLILPLAAFNSTCWAEEEQEQEAPPVKASSISEVIAHLNDAKPWLSNGDVANGTHHIKMARKALAGIEEGGFDAKSVYNDLVLALIQSKKGNPEKATAAIDKAIGTLQAQ